MSTANRYSDLFARLVAHVEVAQDKWAGPIRALGGHARFTTGAIE